MVLEYLLTFKENPKHLLISGFLYSTIAILIASSIFPRSPSMVVVAFMTLPAVYIFTQYFKELSLEELESKNSSEIFKMNFKLAENYTFLFLGMAIGVTVWFSLLPKEMLSNIFAEQIWNLEQIGRATSLGTGAAVGPNILNEIAINNIRLVLLCCILSFVFGAGSLFILSWNASILGVYLGGFIRQGAQSQLLLVTIGILPHAIIEVLAYFLAGIAGGVLSLGLVRTSPGSKEFKLIFKDAFKLLLFAFILVIVGGFVEVYI